MPGDGKEGRLLWRASQANLCMRYDAVQWRAQTEAVHTVDHDQVPVTFIVHHLFGKGMKQQRQRARMEESKMC